VGRAGDIFLPSRSSFSPSARKVHGVHFDAVNVQPIVAPEEAQGPRLQHVHVVDPGELDPPDLADVADGTGRMGHDHPHGRSVLQFHVTAAGQTATLKNDGRKRKDKPDGLSSARLRPVVK